MITWKNYYEEIERRKDLLDEAKHHRLILSCMNNKSGRSGKYLFGIQPKLNGNIKADGFGFK